ncbi:MAG: C4-dicarboxylate ABC transporter [Proteobacteria bacterium]|nr:MAG: C4-dicarboxylate ABC transporter [Pseudomonadota bacterium]
MSSDTVEASLKGIPALLFAVGSRREPDGIMGAVIKLLALGVSLWVLYAATLAIIDPLALAAIFLCFMFALLFLVVAATPDFRRQQPPVYDIVLTLASVACGVYFAIESDRIVERISLLDPLNAADIAVGSTLCLLAIEATRRTVGLGLTLIVLVMLAYNLFGDRLSGLVGHGPISYRHFLDQTLFTTNGIFGAPVRVAATYAFLFVTFGTILERAGGSEFFFNLAACISGRTVGGPAKVAVFSSALYGMVSGSPTSDVVTTGSVTIPMMRRLGYPRSLAGAIEVAASTSGGLIPPVMASAAFIMVEVTGIPYLTIAKAALIPAMLYLLGVFIQVHLLSKRHGLAPMDPADIPRLLTTLRDGGLFIVPLAALVGALFIGYSATLVAVVGIISVIVVSLARKKTRLTPFALALALIIACRRMVPVAAACAAAGLVVGGISMTGLSGKVSILILELAGDGTLLALVLAACLAILLGMGMPTPSAYIMAAVLTAPFLIDLGLTPLTAHMFLLFFAVLSALTPPVAVAAFAASSLAEANPLAIAGRAVLLALPAFIIPFIFAYRPELLGQGGVVDIALATVSAMIGVATLAVAVVGYLDQPLAWWARGTAMGGGLLLMIPGLLTDAMGLVVAVAIVAAPRWRRRRVALSLGRTDDS